jgi:hypothetical protein
MLLRHSYIVIYTTAFVLIAQSFIMHTPQSHTYTVQFPLFPLFPLLTPFCLPLVPPFTYSQVVCKLTPFAPLHPVDPPFPNSRPPTCPTPNNDDLGNILALSVQNSELTLIQGEPTLFLGEERSLFLLQIFLSHSSYILFRMTRK